MRCQASEQPGVCARCLVSRKECIVRKKPRPGRRGPRSSSEDTVSKPLSPANVGSFSINYSIPVKDDPTNAIEALKDVHEHALASILSQDQSTEEIQDKSHTNSTGNASPVQNLADTKMSIWRQPEFDLASAEASLESFRPSLNYLPLLNLPETASVSYLATTKPFVLLAILAVSSGSRTVHKHALYDDEFRKALGLAYVSGGERSVELLQGLLIYCAWYPFHLRPKSEKLVHFLRIARDLVQDLKLDDLLLQVADNFSPIVSDTQLDKTRVYLAYLYLNLTYGVVWKGERELPILRLPCTSIALEILQNNAQVDGDITLVALVRSSSLFADMSETIREGDLQRATECQIILRRLEQDFLELQPTTNQPITGLEAIRFQVMFVDIFLDCGSMLGLPVSKKYASTDASVLYPSLPTLYEATRKIRTFLSLVVDLGSPSLLSFTINDWTRLIVVLTLSFRLSFPLALCPEFDSAYARSQIQLGRFLRDMSQGANPGVEKDLLSASRCMFSLAKVKYDSRLASLRNADSNTPVSRTFGCPVINRNLSISSGNRQSQSIEENKQTRVPLFFDLWATMTMGW
ncbi:hypothetical protein FBEOM_5814 [Fusarium beomiforme]|uniref:Transcription factor domain-containing protein n=1 Tax=Fusarium beomiforme TaxID=44412 RepID=A0A9P5DZN2_9HYPO|nr:hypothetical protein FBEOM_5814 [Fusarium beomiforme]